MEQQEFEKLIGACNDVAEMFPHVIFIGGIAVYLHAMNHAKTRAMAETTHDADFYISLADMGDLRDVEEVTPNRRLSKHQMIKRTFEFDIYTERQSSLAVPYDAVASNAMTYDHIRVAALEELMVLKLRAYIDRAGTAKGAKDSKDLVRIALVAQQIGFDPARAALYLGDDDIAALRRVERSSAAAEMAQGNAQLAKQIRQQYADVLASIIAALDGKPQVAAPSRKPLRPTR